MNLLSGTPVAEKILQGIKEGLLNNRHRPPCLVFVLVGQHGPSQTYVSMKVKACQKVGITSRVIKLDQDVSYLVLKELILELNDDASVDGMIIQMPLPKHLEALTHLINPAKDVDGFTPENMGKLVLGDLTGMIPCTPQGIFHLMTYYGISCENKHVVIMGRSQIVGKPLANLLSLKTKGANASVSLLHAGSSSLKTITQLADILIVACGKAHLVDESYVKTGAVIIDVGINRLEGKIVGDCDFKRLSQNASSITPVPGGVGPMTIACLLLNTYLSYKKNFKDVGSSTLVFEDHLLREF